MNKLRRVVAIIGLIIIALLYICFFILAAMGKSASRDLMMSAFAATIIVPVLLYLLQLIGKNKANYEKDFSQKTEDPDNLKDKEK